MERSLMNIIQSIQKEALIFSADRQLNRIRIQRQEKGWTGDEKIA